MRKLKLQMQISLDGFVAGPNGEMDWMTFDWDEKLSNFVAELTEPIDLILIGRKMVGGFIEAWSSRLNDPEMGDDARKFTETPKVVFSRTIEKSEWENTTLATGNLTEEVNKLKNQPGKDIIVYGGADFVASLIKENLIDEFNLFINPVLINKGLKIFDKLDHRQNLSLIESTSYECGITVLRYRLNQDKKS